MINRNVIVSIAAAVSALSGTLPVTQSTHLRRLMLP